MESDSRNGKNSKQQSLNSKGTKELVTYSGFMIYSARTSEKLRYYWSIKFNGFGSSAFWVLSLCEKQGLQRHTGGAKLWVFVNAWTVTLVPMKKLSCLDSPVPGVQRHTVWLLLVSETIQGGDSRGKKIHEAWKMYVLLQSKLLFVLLISDSL